MLSATPKNFAIQFRPPPPNNEYKTNGTAPQGIRGRATRVWQNAFTYSSNYLWYLFIYLFSSPPLLLPFLFLYDSISFLSFFVFINTHTHTSFIYRIVQSKSPANDRIIVANHFQSTCIRYRIILLRSQYTHAYYLLIQQPWTEREKEKEREGEVNMEGRAKGPR